MNRAKAKELLRYSPDTGIFLWNENRGNSVKKFDIAGYENTQGYICIKIGKTLYLAHRLAWLYMTGEWPNIIDHIDHNRGNNSWSNLRNVSARENVGSGLFNNSFVGVSYHKLKSKWGASAYKDKKLNHLGYFKTHLAACYARWQWEKNYES